MEKFVDSILQVVFSAVDIPFVFGIVFVTQMLKRVIKFKNKKIWILFLIAFGFLASFLKVSPFTVRAFIIQAFIYIASCEFVYQVFQTVMLTWKNKGKKG